MRQVKASEFKAKCLKLIDDVNETGQPIIITKRGKPVARLARERPSGSRRLMGSMAGLLSPVTDDDDLLSAYTAKDLKKMTASRKRRATIIDAPAKKQRR